ncbi:MAG TPA: HAD family phosphatase [Ruminococcus sp.]|nr:HAD family phosphatase [Ruminococcus sp.]
MIKSIIFDLDGTLIDSMGIWYGIDRAFLRENGVTDPPEDISERMKKMTVDESSAYFISFFHLSCTKEYVIRRIEELVRREYEENIPLKPGVAELLDILDRKEIPYGIATATYRSLAEAVLKRCGIYDRFRFLLTDKEYPCGKRRPDIFLGAASRLGTVPRETLVIEDSLHCIRTASDAGFVTAAVYDEAAAGERGEIEKLADHYCLSLDDIPGIIN